MGNLLKIFLISAVPLIEQRGSIPMGIILYNIAPLKVFLVCFLGSMLPVPFILLLFNKIFDWMQNYKIFNSFSNFVQKKLNKNTDKMEKYKELGLITFIAIPLPTTGVWTGTAVAAFLKLDFKKSVICAAIGGLLSATAITAISILIPSLLGY
jgi:uncharacterized membrane protein